MSPAWGMYCGYELEHRAVREGSEEYLDSEKYLNWCPRDFCQRAGPG